MYISHCFIIIATFTGISGGKHQFAKTFATLRLFFFHIRLSSFVHCLCLNTNSDSNRVNSTIYWKKHVSPWPCYHASCFCTIIVSRFKENFQMKMKISTFFIHNCTATIRHQYKLLVLLVLQVGAMNVMVWVFGFHVLCCELCPCVIPHHVFAFFLLTCVSLVNQPP